MTIGYGIQMTRRRSIPVAVDRIRHCHLDSSLWSNGPRFCRISIDLFSWNQVDTSKCGSLGIVSGMLVVGIGWMYWVLSETNVMSKSRISDDLLGGSEQSVGRWFKYRPIELCWKWRKSPRLKGSAMFACVGTRCRIWRRA